jgi:hypothetical protein
MSLSTCTCGGYIPLGPDASNRCDRCGKGPFDQFPPVDIDALMRQRQDEARGPIYRAALEQIARQTKMGRKPKDGEFIHVIGNFSGVAYARRAMDIDWMNRDEMAQAIPPAYTQFIGWQLRAALMLTHAAS